MKADFQSGYSTIDHIHVIIKVGGKYAQYTKPLFMAFIDYEKAFDSMKRQQLKKGLRIQGIEKIYVKT